MRRGAEPFEQVSDLLSLQRTFAVSDFAGRERKRRAVLAALAAAWHGGHALGRHGFSQPLHRPPPQPAVVFRHIQSPGQPVQQSQFGVGVARMRDRFVDLVLQVAELAALCEVLDRGFSHPQQHAGRPDLGLSSPLQGARRIDAEHASSRSNFRLDMNRKVREDANRHQRPAVVDAPQRHGQHRERRFVFDDLGLTAPGRMFQQRQSRRHVAHQLRRSGSR